MRRQEPTSKLDVIGELRLSPEKAVGNFLELKKSQILLIKPPNESLKTDDIECIAIQNDEELQQMQTIQKAMRERNDRQENLNVSRTAKLNNFVNDLRERFSEINNIMQTHDEKRTLAVKAISEHKQIHIELRDTNFKLKQDLKVLHKFRDSLIKTLQDYEPYEKVIDEAVALDDYWQSAQDCVHRCDALMLAQEEIIKLKENKFIEIENIRLNMLRLIKEAQTEIMGLNNHLIDCEKNLVRSRDDYLHWEKELVKVKDCLVGKYFEDRTLRDGFDTIYKGICKHYGRKPKLKQDLKKVDFIREEFHIISGVLSQCQAELNEQQLSKSKLKSKSVKIRTNV